jgi:1,4-alpha-glucan branching enzyme
MHDTPEDPGGEGIRSSIDGRGHLVLFLHAHLPYVRHPGDMNALAEDWFYEAVTETYIPLLSLAEGWLRDHVPARLTLSLSPPLLEMLRDDLLVKRYIRRLHMLLDLAESEVCRTANDERFRLTAEINLERLEHARVKFETRYSADLVAAFKALQDCGMLEIVTSCATHAFLPCFDMSYARAQIRLGAKCYEAHFGDRPAGMWLPECGFVPGVDRLLADEGITYVIVDSHALEFADPLPVFGTYSPIVCPSGVFAFPRDLESSAQVWSAESGYPGDARYQEFYRDVGHDLDGPSIAGFVLPDGGRRNVGLKYHRVTGRDVPLHEKQPYHRGQALEAANEHAGHFVLARRARIAQLRTVSTRPPVIVAPYDAELFGHWWFEGPEFLDLVVRRSARDQADYRLSSPMDVVDSGLDFQVAMPAASSWGASGYSATWLNRKNDWIWPHLHRATDEMAIIARERPRAEGLERRALNQLARELLLASSSDWPFMITMGTTAEYGESRLRTHISRFNRLLDEIRTRTIDPERLARIEACDNIFRDLNYRDLR